MIDPQPFPPLAEFIHLISSEANEVCTKEGKKTIGPKHVIEALKVPLTLHHTAAHTISQPAPVLALTQALGFEDYITEVNDVFREVESMVRPPRRVSCRVVCGVCVRFCVCTPDALSTAGD
jgi:hypothetical protein